MTDLTLVDPEIRDALSFFPPFVFSAETLPELRQGMSAMQIAEPNSAVIFQDLTIDGPAGAPPVRILVYRPRHADAAPRAGLIDIHGGGYILGTPEMSRPLHESLVLELGCVVVSVDYRLAPETRFPGAVEDCFAALKWLHRQAPELGIDPARIGVTGGSAGGGLAAAPAVYVRDRGEQLLAFQHLIYPMLDDRTCLRDPNPHVGRLVWTDEQNHFGWSALLGAEPGSAGVSPHAAAARADDLSGLPPTYLAVGALDLFLQENLDYVSRLAYAGVPVEAHVYPGAYHGFQVAQGSRLATQADRDSRAALARFCG
jgi:acetyl esterase/lipase